MEARDPHDYFRCVNCGTPLKSHEAKLFLSVYVCAGCHETATLFRDRIQAELKQLLVMTDEAIREALVTQKLHLAPAARSRDVPKSELIGALIKMTEERSASRSSSSSDSRRAAGPPGPAGAALREDDRVRVAEAAPGPVGLLGAGQDGEPVPEQRGPSGEER